MDGASRHPAITNNASRLVDVATVFNTTESMSNKIQSLIASLADIFGLLGPRQVHWRFVSVPFGDLTLPGDRIVTDLPFTAHVASAQRQLRSLPRFSGGGNPGESSGEALLATLEREFRPNAVKVVVLVTDEPALGGRLIHDRVDQAPGWFEAICFTIALDLTYFHRWAEQHGGTWQPIGTTIDGGSLMRLFDEVMAGAVRVADEIHTRHSGSVRRYRQRAALPAPATPGQETPPRPLVGLAPSRVLTKGGRSERSRSPRRLTRADERLLDGRDTAPPLRRLGPGSP